MIRSFESDLFNESLFRLTKSFWTDKIGQSGFRVNTNPITARTWSICYGWLVNWWCV